MRRGTVRTGGPANIPDLAFDPDTSRKIVEFTGGEWFMGEPGSAVSFLI